jgi:hypothetical protein
VWAKKYRPTKSRLDLIEQYLSMRVGPALGGSMEQMENWVAPEGTPTERLIIMLLKLTPVGQRWSSVSELLPMIGGTMPTLCIGLDALVQRGIVEWTLGIRGLKDKPVRVYKLVGGATCLSA